MMMDKNPKIEIAIYLRGSALDPDHVTEVLGIAPSRSQFRGEKRISASGKESLTRIGVWVLVSEPDPRTVSEAIFNLASKIPNNGPRMNEIAGVQEAYVDVFIAVDTDSDGGGTSEFRLQREDVDMLNNIDLEVRFTTAVVRP
jgi:hypothetical protein